LNGGIAPALPVLPFVTTLTIAGNESFVPFRFGPMVPCVPAA
jgi:hypothetical protein